MFGPLLLLLDLKMCVLCVLCVGAYSGCPARQPPWWAAETLAEHAGIDIRSRGGGAGRERTRPRRSAGVHQGVCVFTFYVFKIIHPPEPREHLDTGFTLKSESAFRFLALLDTEKSNHITWSSTCLFVTSVVPHSLSSCQRAMRGRSVSMETMSRGGAGLPTSLSGGGLAHISVEVSRGHWEGLA